MIRLFKNKRGVTLVELIIVIAILAVVLSSIYSFNLFGIKTYGIGESQWILQSDVRLISDFITRQARYASEVELTNQVPTANDGYNYIRTEGDNIRYYKNGSLVSSFPQSADTGKKYGVDFSDSSGKILSFKITGNDDGKGRNYSIVSKVLCMNIPDDSSIKITSGSGSIRYKIISSILDLFAIPGDGKVDLVFPKPVGATSVKLYMSDVSASNVSQYVNIPLDSNSTSATVTGLINGKQYWFKIQVTGGDLAGESNVASAVPFKPTELTAKDVADSINSIEQAAVDSTLLKLPTVPDGFAITIKSTSNAGVIDTSGNIITPKADVYVNLVLTVRKLSDSTTADTIPISVLVKAQSVNLSNVGINVTKKELTGTTSDMQYRINGGSWQQCKNTSTSVNIIETGCTINVRITGDESQSSWKTFNLIPPQPPVVSFLKQNKNFGYFQYDSSLSGMLEYSTSPTGTTWQAVSSSKVDIKNISYIRVRKKSTAAQLSSLPTGNLITN